MMERFLPLRLKRAIGFGLMTATAAALFWYVMRAASGASNALAGTAVFWLVAAVVAGGVAYFTIYRRTGRGRRR